MKLARLLFAAVAFAAATTGAQARSNVHWSIGINTTPYYGGPVYYSAPAPVYYSPAPVYYAPAPVYYAPAPVYYAPPVVYVRPRYRHGYHHWYR